MVFEAVTNIERRRRVVHAARGVSDGKMHITLIPICSHTIISRLLVQKDPSWSLTTNSGSMQQSRQRSLTYPRNIICVPSHNPTATGWVYESNSIILLYLLPSASRRFIPLPSKPSSQHPSNHTLFSI